MKKFIATALILASLTGCGAQTTATSQADVESSDVAASSSETSISFSVSDEDSSEQTAADESDTADESNVSTGRSQAQQSTGNTRNSESSSVAVPQTEQTPENTVEYVANEYTMTVTPPQPEHETQPTPQPQAEPTPPPSQVPQATPEPTPAPTPAPTPEPAPQPAPEPAPPAFDVNTWVQFAINSGTGLGMTYDTSVTGSWDNPIVASADSLYLDRDLSGMLAWYQSSGFTKFNVWAEDIGGGRYNIYISYA